MDCQCQAAVNFQKVAKDLQSPYGNDLGSFWSRLNTPNLDKLASKFKYLTDPVTKGQDLKLLAGSFKGMKRSI